MELLLISACIILICKWLRDTALYRWEISIFSKSKAFNWWRYQCMKPFDLIHIADGLIIMMFYINGGIYIVHPYLLKWLSSQEALFYTFWSIPAFHFIFYRLFNLLYHVVGTLPGHRDWRF